MAQYLCRLCRVLETSIDRKVQMRKVSLEGVDKIVSQRRHRAVLMRIQTFEHALASVDDEVPNRRRRRHLVDKAV